MSSNRILKHFNKNLGLAFAVIAISTFNYGFDNAGYSTIQAMEAFQRQFGEINPDTGRYRLPTVWLSLFNSLQFIGFAAGVFIGSVVSHRWGRRWCMFSMSAWALIPATIAITSNRPEQIMAARVLNCEYCIRRPCNVSLTHMMQIYIPEWSWPWYQFISPRSCHPLSEDSLLDLTNSALWYVESHLFDTASQALTSELDWISHCELCMQRYKRAERKFFLADSSRPILRRPQHCHGHDFHNS